MGAGTSAPDATDVAHGIVPSGGCGKDSGANDTTTTDTHDKIRSHIQSCSDLKDLPRLFAAVDTDGNGAIDPMEFAAFITGCVTTSGHDAIAEDDIRATFDFIDTNADGTIDFDEFQFFLYHVKSLDEAATATGASNTGGASASAGASAAVAAPPSSSGDGVFTDEDQTLLRMVFDRIDTSGDGVLQKTELLAAMQNNVVVMAMLETSPRTKGLLDPASFKAALAQLATDKPGGVGFEELVAFAARLPAIAAAGGSSASASASSAAVAALSAVQADHIRRLVQGSVDQYGAARDVYLRVLFDSIDADGDGHITLDEFTLFISGCANSRGDGCRMPTADEINTTFNLIDLDGNGTIEYTEFEAFVQFSRAQCYYRIRELIEATSDLNQIGALFADADKDGDEALSPNEFTALVRASEAKYEGGERAAVSEADIDATFKHIDTSENGLIELDELQYFFFIRKRK